MVPLEAFLTVVTRVCAVGYWSVLFRSSVGFGAICEGGCLKICS